MKPFASKSRLFLTLVAWAGLLSWAGAQTVTQTITLQPGWNAVWLEVEPSDNSTEAVFANLPVASVWTRAERLSPVDFIQDPSETAFNNPAWQRWFPASRPEALLNNLFTVLANRAYLVRITNGAPVEWDITGRPSLRQSDWVPDSFNLRGLPVDAATPPTFLSFLRHSKAHFNPTSGQMEKIYRLHSGTGQWQPVSANDPVQSGAAYWIYTRGASDYMAPLSAQAGLGDGLDFEQELTTLELRLVNRTANAINALVRELSGGAAGHLAYSFFDPELGTLWPELPSLLVLSTLSGSTERLRLAIRRQDFTTTEYVSVLEVRDGFGTRLLVPVSAQRPGFVAALGQHAGKDSHEGPADRAGLWVGAARLNAVSEPHSANPTNPTPTKSEFNLTLIIHVDASGHCRLLKEVTQMWRDGTYTNDASGNQVVEKPGEYVLLTDDTLIPFFSGSAVRDGASVGRRISTIGYDFPSGPTNNFLELAGALEIEGSLTGTLTLPHDHPTNPFKHRYHPDHDNLNARFDGPAMESFTTTREIELQPMATAPDGPAVPDYGYGEIGGTYRETITGIHQKPIHVRGTFRLSRVSLIAELNPAPTP